MPDNITLEQYTELTEAMGSAIAELRGAMDKHYTIQHTPVVGESLEATYNRIIAADNALDTPTGLSEISAVGLTAILKNGNTVVRNGNRMFINGTEEVNEEGYTFGNSETANAFEIVNVWFFGNPDVSLIDNMPSDVDYQIALLDIRQKTGTITLGKDYYYDAEEIYTDGWFNFISPTITNSSGSFYNFLNKRWNTRKMKIFGQLTFNCPLPIGLEELESDCTHMYNDSTAKMTGTYRVDFRNDTISADLYTFSTLNHVGGRRALKKISFPNLKQINNGGVQSSSVCVQYSDNPNIEIDIPVLEQVTASSLQQSSVFDFIAKLTIPETLMNMPKNLTGVMNELILKNKNATNIASNWCRVSLGASFIMCPDWGATINIAVAAASKWDIDDYTNLISGYTKIINPDVAEIGNMYELINGEYVKTSDVAIDSSKTYYFANLRTMTSETVKQLTVPTSIFTQLNAANSCTVDGYTDNSWVEYAAEVKHWTILGA